MLSLLPMFESERSRVKHDCVCVRQLDLCKSVVPLTRVCLSLCVPRNTVDRLFSVAKSRLRLEDDFGSCRASRFAGPGSGFIVHCPGHEEL